VHVAEYPRRALVVAGTAGIGPMAGNWTTPNPPFGAVLTYHLKDTIKTKKQKRREAEKKDPKNSYPSKDDLRAEAEDKALILLNKLGVDFHFETGPDGKRTGDLIIYNDAEKITDEVLKEGKILFFDAQVLFRHARQTPWRCGGTRDFGPLTGVRNRAKGLFGTDGLPGADCRNSTSANYLLYGRSDPMQDFVGPFLQERALGKTPHRLFQLCQSYRPVTRAGRRDRYNVSAELRLAA
jgi:hypothetical protein